MLIAKNNKKGTFSLGRCVYFYLQAEEAPSQRNYDYVRHETTVVPPLPAARPNRAETVQCRQTESTR